MSVQNASIDFFEKLTEEDRKIFSQGFYDTVDFDDRGKEVFWGAPWLHGNFNEEITFVGGDPYFWGVQYAIQMRISGWPAAQNS